jgi:hypothetical protein
LGKDFSFPGEKDELPAFGDGCEECIGIETAPLFGGYKAYSTRTIGTMEVWRTILLLREALFGWPLGDIGTSFCRTMTVSFYSFP